MSIREFFGFEARTNNTEEVREEVNPAILPPARSDHIAIDPVTASRIGTVYRSVNIISTMISQMEMEVYRDGKKIKTPLLVRNPIDGESQSSFVQQCVWSLALWGNCYLLTYGSPVTSVTVLDPDSVTVVKDPATGKTQYYNGPNQLPTDRIRHLKFERLPGALLGIGPLSGAAGELRAAYLLDKFQQQWFDVTGIPSGVLSTPGALNAGQSKAFVEAWNDFLADNRKTAILPGGMKYEAISAKPIELQYVDVAESNIRNIARIFGIPASNLLSALQGTSMTYTNYLEANLQFLQNTLSRYMNEIEDALSDLLPRSNRVEFNEEQLLRMSPEKLWAVKKLQSDVGYYSGAEQRKEEGLPPLPKTEVKPTSVEPDEKAEKKEEVANDE